MAHILFANPGILAAAGVPFESRWLPRRWRPASLLNRDGPHRQRADALAPGMRPQRRRRVSAHSRDRIVAGRDGPRRHRGPRGVSARPRRCPRGGDGGDPVDLRRAIGAGIGLFIAFIGAVNARLVVVPAATVAGPRA
jgi:hypothetical protein